MAERGASVIITGRDEARGASTVEEIRRPDDFRVERNNTNMNIKIDSV